MKIINLKGTRPGFYRSKASKIKDIEKAKGYFFFMVRYMGQANIDCCRYILAWREKFIKGEELQEIKRGKKSWGGERRRKANKAEFLAKQYRKAHRKRLEAEGKA